MRVFNLFEGQLHILLVIIIINILPPVVHGQIVNKVDIVIQ